MTFHLTDKTWEQAEQALIGQPSGTKYDKYEKNLITGTKNRDILKAEHSFIIIDTIIYALSNRHYFEPEEGRVSIVKQGLTKAGKLVAIKIESSLLKDEASDAYQASIKDNLHIGQGLRSDPNMKIKLREQEIELSTEHKLYTVMEWGGQSLFSQISNPNKELTPSQKRILSLRACLLVQALHDKKIIHGDIKAENITADIQGNNISLKAIDFESAHLLKENSNYIIGNYRFGTFGFISPEILMDCRYSILSDTFALAVMLVLQLDIACREIPLRHCSNYLNRANASFKKRDAWLNPSVWLQVNNIRMEPELEKILFDMLHPNFQLRKDASALINYLCESLINDKHVEEKLKEEFRQYIPIKPQPQALLFSKFKTRPELTIKDEIHPRNIININGEMRRKAYSL